MPQPTVNQVHADRPLTNFSVKYMLDTNLFVADKAFPLVPVQKMSDSYYLYDRTYWLRDSFKRRAPGGNYARDGYGISTATYLCEQWALAKAIADEERENADDPLKPDQDAAEFLAQKALIRRERGFAADFMTTGIWTTDNTTATDWDDTTGVPITNVQVAVRTIQQSTGMLANTLVCGLIVHQALKTAPQITDLVKYTSRALPRDLDGIIAAALDIERVLVGGASYESGEEGATSSILPILDDDALVIYAAPNAGINKPTAGATFIWDGGGGMGTVMRVRDDMNDADVAKMKMAYDQVKVANVLGYFFSDIV